MGQDPRSDPPRDGRHPRAASARSPTRSPTRPMSPAGQGSGERQGAVRQGEGHRRGRPGVRRDADGDRQQQAKRAVGIARRTRSGSPSARSRSGSWPACSSRQRVEQERSGPSPPGPRPGDRAAQPPSSTAGGGAETPPRPRPAARRAVRSTRARSRTGQAGRPGHARAGVEQLVGGRFRVPPAGAPAGGRSARLARQPQAPAGGPRRRRRRAAAGDLDRVGVDPAVQRDRAAGPPGGADDLGAQRARRRDPEGLRAVALARDEAHEPPALALAAERHRRPSAVPSAPIRAIRMTPGDPSATAALRCVTVHPTNAPPLWAATSGGAGAVAGVEDDGAGRAVRARGDDGGHDARGPVERRAVGQAAAPKPWRSTDTDTGPSTSSEPGTVRPGPKLRPPSALTAIRCARAPTAASVRPSGEPAAGIVELHALQRDRRGADVDGGPRRPARAAQRAAAQRPRQQRAGNAGQEGGAVGRGPAARQRPHVHRARAGAGCHARGADAAVAASAGGARHVGQPGRDGVAAGAHHERWLARPVGAARQHERRAQAPVAARAPQHDGARPGVRLRAHREDGDLAGRAVAGTPNPNEGGPRGRRRRAT